MGVGYGPKLFQSVLRFQRLVNLAASAGISRNIARFAADADYADQAHMTPEVQRFSGNSPRNALFALSGLIGTHPSFLSSARC